MYKAHAGSMLTGGVKLAEMGFVAYQYENISAFFPKVKYNYPAPAGRGIVFGRFLSFFVSLSATLRENGWTDLHEIFREGVE